MIFRRKDFYSRASYGAHIRGPVSTSWRSEHLGVDALPGVRLQPVDHRDGPASLNPPSWRAGQAARRGSRRACSWRNVARILVPDMTGFRDWNFSADTTTHLGRRLRDPVRHRRGTAVSDAKMARSTGRWSATSSSTPASRAVGREQAARKLIPTPRNAAQPGPARMVLESGSGRPATRSTT